MLGGREEEEEEDEDEGIGTSEDSFTVSGEEEEGSEGSDVEDGQSSEGPQPQRKVGDSHRHLLLTLDCFCWARA